MDTCRKLNVGTVDLHRDARSACFKAMGKAKPDSAALFLRLPGGLTRVIEPCQQHGEDAGEKDAVEGAGAADVISALKPKLSIAANALRKTPRRNPEIPIPRTSGPPGLQKTSRHSRIE